MSDRWRYDPEICEGRLCIGDCDQCSVETPDDTISRQAAINALEEYADRLQMVSWKENPGVPYKAYALNWCINTIRELPSAQKTGRWIPVKTRHMTDEERKYWEEHFGMEFDEYDAFIFDCPMPEDGQTVWLTTKNGYLFQDVAENDDWMCGLEGNGDWDDIVAWMPVYKPEPYKEDTNG